MAEFKHGNRKKSMKRGISASAGKKRNNAARKTLLEKDESAEEDDELKIEDVLELGGDQVSFEFIDTGQSAL